jgi:glycosyltransferase involved in cell wall biosynthesis
VRIGFDISQIAHGGGVARYTQNLAEEISKSKELETIFFYSSLRKPYKGRLKNVKKFRLPPTLFEVLFNKLRNVPIEQFLGPIDIFHSSDWIQPPTKAKKVTTFHDVIPLKFPKWSHPKIVEVHKRRLKIVEKEVDMVIAVSESTKKDLLEISNIPEKKIKVIYEGVGSQFKPQPEEEVENFRKKYNLPKEFVLALGGIGERKNLANVKKASKNYELVITGENFGPFSDQEMPLLYSASKVLLYPSLYEGFGLPILEAMACGTPVITSNNSSIPEIGKDAVVYAEPGDVQDIEDKLSKIFTDEEMKKNLSEKGIERAREFTWEKCALETVSIYKSLLNA